jgi:hypothetical protein
MARDRPGVTPPQRAWDMRAGWNGLPAAARSPYGEVPPRRSADSGPKKKEDSKSSRVAAAPAAAEKAPEVAPEPSPPPPVHEVPPDEHAEQDMRQEIESAKRWRAEMELALRMLARLGTFDYCGHVGYPMLRGE